MFGLLRQPPHLIVECLRYGKTFVLISRCQVGADESLFGGRRSRNLAGLASTEEFENTHSEHAAAQNESRFATQGVRSMAASVPKKPSPLQRVCRA